MDIDGWNRYLILLFYFDLSIIVNHLLDIKLKGALRMSPEGGSQYADVIFKENAVLIQEVQMGVLFAYRFNRFDYLVVFPAVEFVVS